MATNMLELKKKAVQYYNENQIPQQLENLLNSMFYEQPVDLFGYMSEYFATLSKPATINRITCFPSFSSTGHENITASVSCCIKGKVKIVAKLQTFADDRQVVEPATAKQSPMKGSTKRDAKNKAGKKENVEVRRNETPIGERKSVFSYSHFSLLLQEVISDVLNGVEVFDQKEVDEKLQNLSLQIIEREALKSKVSDVASPQLFANEATLETEDSSKEIPSSTPPVMTDIHRETNMACFFASTLLSVTAATTRETPLYECLLSFSQLENRIMRLRVSCGRHELQISEPISLPVLAVPFVSCDPSTPGKLNVFKEILLVPKLSLDAVKSVNYLLSFCDGVEQALTTNFSSLGQLRNSCGVLTPPFDKPEQIFELLSTTSKSLLQLEFFEVFDVVINVGADMIFDKEKKKYEMSTGIQKSTDDMIAMYKTWLDSLPVIGFIDALSANDEFGQEMLFKELSHQCFIFTSQSKHIEDAVKVLNEKHCDGVVISADCFASTWSNMSSNAQIIKDNGGNIMFTDEWCNIFNSSIVVDMAIAVKSLFIRTPSPASGAALYIDRVLHVYTNLKEKNSLSQREEYVHVARAESPTESNTEENIDTVESAER